MSITRKSMIIKISILIINMVLVFFLAHHFILDRFALIERDQMQSVLQRAKYMLDDTIEIFDREVLNYVTGGLVHGIDSKSLVTFLKSAQSDVAFTNLNLNLVMVADGHGNILDAVQFDQERGVRRNVVDPEILVHFSSASPLVKQTDSQVARKGFLRCGDLVLMVASRPLLKDAPPGSGEGTIIFGRFLDMNTVRTLERNLASELFFPQNWVFGETHQAAVEKELASHILKGEKSWTDEQDHVMAGGMMTDIYGKDAFMVVVQRSRTIYQMGYQNFFWFINIMFFALMALAFVNLAFLRTIVLRRITLLGKQVGALAAQESLEERITMDEAKDEITALACCINGLLDAQQNMLLKIKKQQKEQTFLSKKLALAQMGSGIAHEISNPFATIMATTHREIKRMGAGDYTIGEAEAAMQLINKTTERISQIIRGMQTLIRDGSGDLAQLHTVDTLVGDAVRICSNALDTRKIALLIGLPSGELALNCRAIEIVQVLVNLITNAKDALIDTPNPWIRIQAEKTNSLLKISVTNNGPRISPTLCEKIMEPFFSTKEVGKGSGLGLSISQKIIEEHQGRLYVDQDDKETCFVLEFADLEHGEGSDQTDLQTATEGLALNELLNGGL